MVTRIFKLYCFHAAYNFITIRRRIYDLKKKKKKIAQVAELNLGFSKKEVIPSLPLKKGGSSLPPPSPTLQNAWLKSSEVQQSTNSTTQTEHKHTVIHTHTLSLSLSNLKLPISWFTKQGMKEIYWFALSRDVTALSLWADAESSRDDWRKARAFPHLRGSLPALRLDNCGKELILAGLYTSRALD